MKEEIKTHDSYGMISISRFQSSHSEFFGSDLVHNNGIRITINKAELSRQLNIDYYDHTDELIEIELTNNQFVDAITSSMNTIGVPCTITRFNGERIEQIDHVVDKKEQFRNDMGDIHSEYKKRIDDILSKLDDNIGKKKANDIKHDLEVLRSHISSNTNFVMKCFNEAMGKTVSEAKHSISNYIDTKVHSLGIEGLKKDLQISIEKQ